MRRVWGGIILASLLAAGPALAATIELNYFYPVGVSGPLTTLMNGLVEEFNKSQAEIRVQPTYAGDYSQTRIKVQAAVVGGAPPDVVVLGATDLYTMKVLDAIIPLDDFLAREGKEYLEDFFPAFLLNSRLDGKIWSIPFQRSTPILYYNKDAFRKAGLDPDKPPKTWDELVAFAKKLMVKDAAGNVTQWGVSIPTSCTNCTYWLFQGFVHQAGGKYFEPDGKKVHLTSAAAKDGMRLWHDLAYTHQVMAKGVIAWQTVANDFLAQKVAMFYHSTGSLGHIRNNAQFAFGTALMPAKTSYGSPTGGANFYIFKNIPRERQEAAWKFIAWMTKPERAAKWSIDSGYIAIRKSAYQTPLMRDFLAKWPQYLVAREQLQYAQTELMTYDNEKIYEIINTMAQAVMTGRAAPEAALESAQKQADEALGKFK